jgi:hypothetical protein
MWTARIGLLVVVTFGMATCGGREAIRVCVEVRGTSTETPEAVAKAVLTNLPTAALRERLQRRVLDVPLDGITVTTSTRTERAHPEGGQTTVKVWLESRCRIEAGSPPSAKWQTRAAIS